MCGVGLIFISCCLFVHLGLGKAICKELKVKVKIINCPKCLTFWSILAYTAFSTDYKWELCLATSFILSYAALWMNLALAKIAKLYEKLYEQEV